LRSARLTGRRICPDSVHEHDTRRIAPGETTWEAIVGDEPTIFIIDEIAHHLRQLTSSGNPEVRRQAKAIPPFLKGLFELAAGNPKVVVIITLARRPRAVRRLRTTEVRAVQCPATTRRCASPTRRTSGPTCSRRWTRGRSRRAWLLLNAEAIVELDTTAVDALRQLARDLARRRVVFAMARVKLDLSRQLVRGKLMDVIDEERIYPTLPVALEAYARWSERR
jgi:hypothetical protein